MKKTSALEFNLDRMIAELEQLVIDRKQGDLSKYRITRIQAPEVKAKTAEEILALREKKIRMSRTAFAKVLNVPKDTLRAWEKGLRNPSGAAVRLLDIIDQQPSIARSCIVPDKATSERVLTATKKAEKSSQKVKRPSSRSAKSRQGK
jgi:putative transcriptional regulator